MPDDRIESRGDVSLRDYFEARMDKLDNKIDGLSALTRRELDLLSEDRERQRHELSERLEGMNALRAQLDRQAGTFATRERVEALERTSWRALVALGAVFMVVQILATLLLRAKT